MSMVSSDTTVTEQDHKHRPECGTEQRFRSAVEPDFENETMIGKEVGKEVGTKTEAMGNTENNTRVQDTTNRNSKNSDIFDSPSGDNSGGIDDTLMVEGGDNDNHEYNINTDKYHLLDLTTEIDPLINKGGIKMNRFPTPTSGAAFIKYYNEYLDKQENNLEVDGKKQNRDYWLGEFPETPEFMKPRSVKSVNSLKKRTKGIIEKNIKIISRIRSKLNRKAKNEQKNEVMNENTGIEGVEKIMVRKSSIKTAQSKEEEFWRSVRLQMEDPYYRFRYEVDSTERLMLDLEKLRKSGGEDQKSKKGTNLRKTVSYEQLDNTVQPEIDVNRRNSTKSKIKLKRSTSQRSSLVVFDQLKKITKDLAKGFSLHSNSSRTSIKSERTRDTENEQGLSNIHDRTQPGTVEKAKKQLVGLNASAVKNSSNGGLDENEIEDLVKLAPIKLSTVGGDRLRFKIGEVDSALFGTFGNSGSMVGNSSRGEYGYVGSEDFSNINININVNSNINSNSSIDGEENSLSKPIANIDNRLNSVHDSLSVEKSTSPFSNQYMTSKQLIQQYTQNIRPRVIESMTKQNEDDSLWMEDDQSVKSYDPSKEVGGQADNYSTNNKSISVNNNSNSIGNISFNISIENVDSVNSSREDEHFMTVRGSPLKENHRLNENVDNFKAFTDKNMDEFEYHKEKEKLDKLRLDILKRNISNYSEENISVVTTESLESLETQSDSSKGSVHLHRTIKLDKFPVRLIVPAENIYIKPELKMANDSQNQPNRRSIVLTTIKDQFTKPTNSDTNRNERLIENTTINVNVNADSDNAYKTQRVDKRLDNIELKKFSTGSFLIEGFTSENDNNQYNEANKKTTQNQNQTQNQSESVYHNDIDKINASVDMGPKELLDTDHSVSGNGIINVVDYVINREFGREGESKVEKEREIQVESSMDEDEEEEEEEEYYSAKSLLFEDGEIVDFPVNDTILNNTQADDNNNGSKESMGNQNDDSDLYTSSSMTTISSLSSLTESNGNTSVVGNQHSSDNIHNILKRYSSGGKDPHHMQNIRKSIISNNLELLSSAHVNHSKQRPSSVVLYNHDNSNKVSFSKEYLFNNKTVHDLETRERLDQYKYRLSLAGLEECWTSKQSEILDHSEERRPNNKKIRQKRSGGKENVEVDIEINESRDKEGHEQVVDEMYKRMNHKDNEYSDQANLIKQHLMLSSSFDFKDKKDPADFIDSGEEVEYKHNSNVAGLNHHNNIEVYNENAENERTSMINQYYEYSQFYETGGINSYNQDNTNDSNGDKKNNYNTQSTVFSRAESMNKRAADKSIAKNKTNNNIDTNTNTNTNANAIAIANANTNSYRLDINALDAKYNQNNFANNRASKSLNNDSNIVSKMKKFAPENKGRNRSGNRVKSFITAKDLVDSNKSCNDGNANVNVNVNDNCGNTNSGNYKQDMLKNLKKPKTSQETKPNRGENLDLYIKLAFIESKLKYFSTN